jgi:hypothetical protein
MQSNDSKGVQKSIPRRQFLKWASFLATPFFTSWNLLQFLFPSKAKAGGFIPFSFVKKNNLGPSDIFYANTQLLLNGDGISNGQQNTTFVDSSSNNATITRYGDVTQGSFSPFGNSWGVYFDGAGDNLSIPVTSSNLLSTGDFTIECWYYAVSKTQAYPRIIAKANGAGWSANEWCLMDRSNNSSSNRFSFEVCNHNSTANNCLLSTTLVKDYTWYHLAVTRSGNTLRLFINGAQESTVTMSASLDGNTVAGNLYVGGTQVETTVACTNSNISNVRIVKGNALYTTNFSPSTSPLTAVTGTVLLTCQSNRFVDNSALSSVITSYGESRIVRESPYPEMYNKTNHGGSATFDGNGDYLTAPAAINYSLGTGDFTVEAWVYLNGYNTTSYQWACFVSTRQPQAGLAGSWGLFIRGTSGNVGRIGFGEITVSPLITINSASLLPLYSWHHIAVTRSSSSLKIFINGVLESTITDATNYNSTTYPLTIATAYDPGATGDINGYISNLRVVKGTALYSSNFTVPTSPLAAVTNTLFLMKCENAGVYDLTAKNNIYTVDNAQISTANKKYGTGSMYFDGTNDMLSIPYSQLNNLGTGDFTLECWFKATSVPVLHQALISSYANNSVGSWAIKLRNTSTDVLGFAYFDSTWRDVNTSISVMSDLAWHHVAVVRSSSTLTIYVDGVNKGSFACSAALTGGGNPLTIAYIGNDNTYTPCYVDDVRITKGIARYTANFTPPALTLPIRG